MREKTAVRIAENTEIAPGIYRLALADLPGAETVADIAAEAAPGQFVNVYLNSASMLLPRPFGISDVVVGEGGSELVFVYSVAGAGTTELSTYAPGAEVRILGPQGNGYDLDGLGKNVILIGGGLGIPPLLFAARRVRERLASGDDTTVTALLGYRDDPYYSGAMNLYCDEVFSISEAGYDRSEGDASVYDIKGTVMDLAARLIAEGRFDLSNASILSCGPMPMLRAVAEWAEAKGVPAQVSLEERMGCGYGACVGCTVEVKSTVSVAGEDESRDTKRTVPFVSLSMSRGGSQVMPALTTRRKVCKDGPVFPADSIVW
jgi:dihydroorotate dehydrogenase electron transfer subunit